MGTAHKDFEQSKITAKTCLDLLLAWITAKTNLLSAKYTTRTRLRRPGRSALGVCGLGRSRLAAVPGRPPPTLRTAVYGLMCVLDVCAFYVHRTGHSRTHHCGVSLKSPQLSRKNVSALEPGRGHGPLVPSSLLTAGGHVRGPTEPAFAVRAHADKEAAHAIDKTLAPRVL